MSYDFDYDYDFEDLEEQEVKPRVERKRNLNRYGDIDSNFSGKVLATGRDWVKVLKSGKPIYVFKWVFENDS